MRTIYVVNWNKRTVTENAVSVPQNSDREKIQRLYVYDSQLETTQWQRTVLFVHASQCTRWQTALWLQRLFEGSLKNDRILGLKSSGVGGGGGGGGANNTLLPLRHQPASPSDV